MSTPFTPRFVNSPDEQTVSLLSGVLVLRIALLVWAAVVVAIDSVGVTQLRTGAAVATLVALGAWTTLYGWWVRHRPRVVGRPWVASIDVGLAALVAGADMFVYSGPHPQSFASAWPLCAAVVAGIVHGARIGALSGALIGVAGAVGVWWFREGGLDGRVMGVVGTFVLMTVAGALAGVVTDLLRRAEVTAARAQAREDVARRLHDGVLQTLAAVQRRSEDPELVALARDQELDLRRFISDEEQVGSDDLLSEMRRTLAAAEHRTTLRCELVVIDAPATTTVAQVEGLCGAVNEAVTNAAKHGGADRVVVCIDTPEGGAGILCTVNDDGLGFDAAVQAEGTGLSRSIRGRIEDLGGTVHVSSRPGAGCDLTLQIP